MERHDPKTPDDPQDSIVITWHIDDVREVRPDLTDEECREVLRECERHYDAEIGINWDVLRDQAEDCFPEAGEDAL